jgi:hypothetical protein
LSLSQIEALKQNLTNSLTHAQQDHQSAIERLTTEHEQIIANLKIEFSKQKSTSESEYLSIIHEKTDEIDNLHQKFLSQRSQFDSHQDTIEHLRKELHENEIKLSQFDHLLDEQNHLSQTIIRLKNVLGLDGTDHDEFVEQLVQKMEQFQLLKTESEHLNNDFIKQKSEQINLHNELQQLEQQFDDNKDELNKIKQELLTNKNKYENQINQLNQSLEQLQNEKHSIEIQFENLQTQFIDKTNQYDHFQTKFHQLSIEKDEQILKYKNDLNQQQILNDNLRRELNDLHDEFKSKTNEVFSLQTNFNKLQQTLQTKIDEIERFSQEKITLTEAHTALEEKFNNILAEKAGLENQLDSIRVQMQTTESNIKEKKHDQIVKLEQSEKRIKELQVSDNLFLEYISNCKYIYLPLSEIC